MMKSQTFEERMESHEKNQNAHVITKRNEDYYATSKVIIDKYDLKRYAKKKPQGENKQNRKISIYIDISNTR